MKKADMRDIHKNLKVKTTKHVWRNEAGKVRFTTETIDEVTILGKLRKPSAAAERALATCDMVVCSKTADGGRKWELVAYHGTREDLFAPGHVADARNRSIGVLGVAQQELCDRLLAYYPSDARAYLPYGYYAIWSASYNPETRGYAVRVVNDRKRACGFPREMLLAR